MNNFDILPFELRKLGLTEREAKIYLISLELTKATAYEIAKKASISRPTVYRVLRGLEKKKLVSQTKEKNKKYFTASSPEELLGMLKIKRREAEEQEREFLRIISMLQTKYSVKNKCKIKIYKGHKSRKGLLENFSNTLSKEIKVIFIGRNPLNLKKEYIKINNRLRNIRIREIYFGNFANRSSLKYVNQKILSADMSSEMAVIIADSLIVIKENTGFYIENEDIKDIFQLLFDSIWVSG
ncbi:MAG: helix-turn-helix domain-containing protein [Candidatus Moranbacteria bacterium]|jgi:sugar-specific transcriptional regulator TrmB|nr:helix-turn-helix domain-containing protein [Candidatus Moranbacteria bacterium]MDD5652323.1 helix-turn-helix domain-containing protein [Candidatus Moranbacteria bacterium]MDX9855967.1 helix-turn-helix domain-containing protein [Candidatus Moranbacteria bacterium]